MVEHPSSGGRILSTQSGAKNRTFRKFVDNGIFHYLPVNHPSAAGAQTKSFRVSESATVKLDEIDSI
jgi:hypothetical protein